jgi:ATP-dependent Clp protease ATP-binding subunit ClpB
VLGRNLEASVTRAMELKAKMGDAFVSVEHLVLALAEDSRFGEALFKGEGLTKAKLDEAVKEVGGGRGAAGWGGKAGEGGASSSCADRRPRAARAADACLSPAPPHRPRPLPTPPPPQRCAAPTR